MGLFGKRTGMTIDDLKGIHELDKFGGLTSDQKNELKAKVGVLVVDDQDAFIISDALENLGYLNVKPIRKTPREDEISKYPIIITDVAGIGEELQSNGLELADRIKRCYPLKQVIVASGQLQKREYREAQYILRKVDGVFKKGTSYESLNDQLMACICRVFDPALVWRQVRDELLRRGGDEKKDTAIAMVAVWEDQFVRQFLQVNGRQSFVELSWAEKMLQIIGFAEQVVNLLSGIRSLFPDSSGV